MTGDLMNIISHDAEDVANIIEAVRALAGTAKEGASAIRRFLGPVFTENLRKTFARSEQLRDTVSPDRKSEPNPATIIPIVDACMQESRTELQELWAALLANAMIDGGKKVRRDIVEAVRTFEPADAQVLEIFTRAPQYQIGQPGRQNFLESTRAAKGLTPDEWQISLSALTTLNCIRDMNNGAGPQLMPFGRQLLAACSVSPN